MPIFTSQPSKILEPFVNQYWQIDTNILLEKEYTQRIIPCGFTELEFFLSSLPKVKQSNKSYSDKVLLSGQQKSFYDLEISGALSMFSIVFKPEGIMAFFEVPMDEIADQNVSVLDLNKKFQSSLLNKIEDASSFEKRIQIVENFLISHLQNFNRKGDFQRIERSIQEIKNSYGSINLDTLASTICLSRKQFERQFVKYVGLSPKQFQKVIRFQYALFQKSTNENYKLTDLAYDSGYYDQSHFINDFKLYTGHTPKNYFSKYPAFSDFYNT